MTGDITATIEQVAGIEGSLTSGTFTLHEVLTQATSGATGVYIAGSTARITIEELHGTPDSTHNWVGSGGAIWTPTAVPKASFRYGRIQVAGFTTGATYALGYSGNNVPSSSTPYFTVTSMGFDTTGAATTISRKIYLTASMRLPYPNNASLDEQSIGGNLVVAFALSDDVYLKDNTGGGNSGTAPTFTAPSAFVTNTGGASQTSTTTSAVTATNYSTLAYPKVISQWAMPHHQRATGSTFLVEMIAAHRFARNASQVACVKFDATDNSSHSATQQVTTAMTLSTIDTDSASGNKVTVYKADIPLSALTQGDICIARFRAYPWVGDSSSVADSQTGVALPTSLLTNLPFLNDKSGTYGTAYAVVDDAQADDSSGVVSTTLATAEAGRFKTITGALTAVKSFNNSNFSRNTIAGGVVYLVTGNYSAPTSFTGGNTTGTHCMVASHPTLGSKAGCVINTGTFFSGVTGLYKFDNFTWNVSTALVMVSGYYWFNKCTITINGAEALGYYSMLWLTNNTVGTITFGGGGDPAFFGVMRGNDFAGATRAIPGVCSLGNKGARGGADDNGIVAFNTNFNEPDVWSTNPGGFTTGIAMLGNIAERVGGDPSPLSEYSLADMNHFVGFHNTYAGNRFNHENDIDGHDVNYVFTNWSWKFNAFTARGDHAADTRDSNGTKIGTNSVRYSYGWQGNWNEGYVFTGDDDYWGLYCNSGVGGAAGYVDDQSHVGGDSGNGDYTPAGGSNLLNLVQSGEAVLPYDLFGNPIPNDGTGSAGATQVISNVINGSGMFALI